MPLSVLQCPGQSPPQAILQLPMPIVLRLTDPGLETPNCLGARSGPFDFLEGCEKQHCKVALSFPVRATSVRVGSILDGTDTPYSFRTTQIF